VGYVPRGYGHSIENDSEQEPGRLLVAYNTGHYEPIDLSLWLATNPDYLLAANLGVLESVIKKLPRRRVFIAGKDGPEKQPLFQASQELQG
jgi:oxalate decarboxylase